MHLFKYRLTSFVYISTRRIPPSSQLHIEIDNENFIWILGYSDDGK